MIAFFVIIDSKDFNRYNDVQTVQSESTTTKRKPSISVLETRPMTKVKRVVETMPAETKLAAGINPVEDPLPSLKDTLSVETKPVAEIPIETKPIIEAKPVTETKPSTVKPFINNVIPIAETRFEEKPAPAAVPVVTAENAEELNAEAIAYALAQKENNEPFYTFYQNTKLETICFQGTIRAISTIPDPKKNDYDDCLYTLFVELNSLLLGYANYSIAREVIVAVPIMKDKIILKNNNLLPGDKVLCTCAAYDAMPQEIQEIQLSDDIQSFEHLMLYALEIKRIDVFYNTGNYDFSTREITIHPIQMLPQDGKAVKLRKERIQNEILRIEKEIENHGGSFQEWKKLYKPIADKYTKLCEEMFRGWINDSFFATAGHETSSYNTKRWISEILPYKQYLENNNIDLIVVRIPSKWDFAARVLASDEFQENPVWVEHYYECLKNDIEIVDPMHEMWKERFDHPLFYFYQQDHEPHPFEGMYLASAKYLSNVLERYGVSKDDAIITLGDTEFGSNAYKDERRYYPLGNFKFSNNNKLRELSFKCILRNGNKMGKLKTYGESPILFLSNSYFGITYMQDQGASLPHYLSYYLKHIVDWKYQNGMGNIMLRKLISDRSALNNRKVIVMVGAYDSFGGGFSVLPKYISEGKSKIVLIKSILASDFEVDIDNFDINNGTMMIDQPKTKDISIDLEIPPMNNYNDCMIRINFPICHVFTKVKVVDSNNKHLDEEPLTGGNDISIELFLPASSLSQKVKIVLTPSYINTFCFGIRNIEVWGF